MQKRKEQKAKPILRARSSTPRGRAGRENRAKRVAYCADLMVTGRWKVNESTKLVAELFEVSTHTVDRDAAEASRRIEGMALTDKELKDKLEAALDELLELARDAAREGNYKAVDSATNVVRTWSQLRGVNAPQQHDVGGTIAAVLAIGLGEARKEIA